MADKEHPTRWLNTANVMVGLVALIGGGAISWAANWAAVGHRVTALEREVAQQKVAIAKMTPVPTAKEQQCTKLIADLSEEIRRDFSKKSDLRELAEDAECLPRRDR